MKYIGGKARICEPITDILQGCSRPIWEPFCGALNISQYLPPRSILSDLHCATIYTYRAMMNGWEPPDNCSEEEYQEAKKLPFTNPLVGFLGHACSYRGCWQGSYAKDDLGTNYCATGKRTLTKKVQRCSRSIFRIDFLEVEPFPLPFAIYCDPPYHGTADSLHFDTEKFIGRIEEWSKLTTVYVSEYNFPLGRVIWEKEVKCTFSPAKNSPKRIERLYKVSGDDIAYDLSASEYAYWSNKFREIEGSQND